MFDFMTTRKNAGSHPYFRWGLLANGTAGIGDPTSNGNPISGGWDEGYLEYQGVPYLLANGRAYQPFIANGVFCVLPRSISRCGSAGDGCS